MINAKTPLILLLFVFVATTHAYTCFQTFGSTPCECNDYGNKTCDCHYESTCLSRPALTCSGQCGNGFVEGNYTISSSKWTCTNGCGAQSCYEACDSGAAKGTFVNNVCCTQNCQQSRSLTAFNRLNIAPVPCSTVAVCPPAPLHTVTCTSGFCSYVPQLGAYPVVTIGNGTRYCPKFPCFDTAPDPTNTSCLKSANANNIATLTSSSLLSWYNDYDYYSACYQNSSVCWTTTPTCTGDAVTSTPLSQTHVLQGGLASMNFGNYNTTFAFTDYWLAYYGLGPFPYSATVSGTYQYLSTTCSPNVTFTKINATHMNANAISTIPACSVQLAFDSFCGLRTTRNITFVLTCQGFNFNPFNRNSITICSDSTTPSYPVAPIANIAYRDPPTGPITYSLVTSNCTGVSISSGTLFLPPFNPITCSVTIKVNTSCSSLNLVRVVETKSCVTATKTCFETNGVQPCICQDFFGADSCNCHYENTCSQNPPITCDSQCGNNVVENSIVIRHNNTPCSTGCDLTVAGDPGGAHVCSEVCDAGGSNGYFNLGTCCTRVCGQSRSISSYDRGDIVPRRCLFASDCPTVPGYTITCSATKWCSYTSPTGIVPITLGNGTKYCPKYPCYNTVLNASETGCEMGSTADNLASFINPVGSSWYGDYDYNIACQVFSSNCWTGPVVCNGTEIAATPVNVSITLGAAHSPVTVYGLTNNLPISDFVNPATVTPSSVGGSFQLVTHDCFSTITQIGDRLQFNGTTQTASCDITFRYVTECSVRSTTFSTHISNLCAVPTFLPASISTVCTDRLVRSVPLSLLIPTTYPSDPTTYSITSSNCTGLSVSGTNLLYPNTVRTCSITFSVNDQCNGGPVSVTRDFSFAPCCGNTVIDASQGETCDIGPPYSDYLVDDTCCTLTCNEGSTDDFNLLINARKCVVDPDCDKPGAVPPVVGICTSGWCKWQPTNYTPPGGCATVANCPPSLCWQPNACTAGTCFYVEQGNIASTMSLTQCRNDTACHHTITCNFPGGYPSYTTPTISVTGGASFTAASQRCSNDPIVVPASSFAPVSWSSTSPVFGAPTYYYTIAQKSSCALTPVITNGVNASITFMPPWNPAALYTCSFNVTIKDQCGGSTSVTRSFPFTCCGDNVIQGGAGEICDVGVQNNNELGYCCNDACEMTPDVVRTVAGPAGPFTHCLGTHLPNITMTEFFNFTFIPDGHYIISYALIAQVGCVSPNYFDLTNTFFFSQMATTCNLTISANIYCSYGYYQVTVTRTNHIIDCCGNGVIEASEGETCDNNTNAAIGYVSNGTCCNKGCQTNSTSPSETINPQKCSTPADCLPPSNAIAAISTTLCTNGWCQYRPSNFHPPGGDCAVPNRDCPIASCYKSACNSTGHCVYSGDTNLDSLVRYYKCDYADVCQGGIPMCNIAGYATYTDTAFTMLSSFSSNYYVSPLSVPLVLNLSTLVSLTATVTNGYTHQPLPFQFSVVPAPANFSYPNYTISNEIVTFFDNDPIFYPALYSTKQFSFTVLNPCTNISSVATLNISLSSCGDGVVNSGNGEQCDPGTNPASQPCCDPDTCLYRSNSYLCDPTNSSTTCKADGYCSGTSATCPSNPAFPMGTQCYTAPPDSECTHNATCPGGSYYCDSPYYSNSTPCHYNSSDWCFADFCDGLGSCIQGPLIVYNDGLFCNGQEACDPQTGQLVYSSPAPNCSYPSNPCYTTYCNETLQECVNVTNANTTGPCGSPTDVGACQFGELQCNSSGVFCVGAIAPSPEACFPVGIDEDCDGMIDEGCIGLPCFNDTGCAALSEEGGCRPAYCHPTELQCYSGVYLTNNEPCDDGNPCTINDHCGEFGICYSDDVVCPDMGECIWERCNTSSGFCYNDTTAFDTFACTCDSACQNGCHCNTGTCTGGTNITCPPAAECYTFETCDPDLGCLYNYANNISCYDFNSCTINDICYMGTCAGEFQCVQDPDYPCLVPTGACTLSGHCIEQFNSTYYCIAEPDYFCYANGTHKPGEYCQICDTTQTSDDWTYLPDYVTNCYNSSTMTLCQQDSYCEGGGCTIAEKNCSHLDSQCGYGACDLNTGDCVLIPYANGTACTYSNTSGVCFLSDSCLSGQCVRNYAVGTQCYSSMDAQCDANSYCVDGNDNCPSPPLAAPPSGTPCTHPDLCVVAECQNYMCTTVGVTDCSNISTGCLSGFCNSTAQECQTSPNPNGTPCDIGQSGDCYNSSICMSSQCTPVPYDSSVSCPDPVPCVTGSHCSGITTECVAGDPLDCSYLTTTGGVGVCDPQDNVCIFQPNTNNSFCDADGNPCTIHDTVIDGDCVPGPPMNCQYLTNYCEVGTCIPVNSAVGVCVAFPSMNNCTPTQCAGGCTFVPGYWQAYHSESKTPSRRIPWPNRSQKKGLCGKTWLEWMRTPLHNYAWRKLFVHWVSAKLDTYIGACVPQVTNQSMIEAYNLLKQCNLQLRTTSPASTEYIALASELESYTTGLYGAGQCTDSIQFDCTGSNCPPSIHRMVVHNLKRSRSLDTEEEEEDLEGVDDSYPLSTLLAGMVDEQDCINGEWEALSSQCLCSFGWAGPKCTLCAIPADSDYTYICIPALGDSIDYILKAVHDTEVDDYLSKRTPLFNYVNVSAIYPNTNGYDCSCNPAFTTGLVRRVDEPNIHYDILSVYQESYEQCERLLEQHVSGSLIEASRDLPETRKSPTEASRGLEEIHKDIAEASRDHEENPNNPEEEPRSVPSSLRTEEPEEPESHQDNSGFYAILVLGIVLLILVLLLFIRWAFKPSNRPPSRRIRRR